MHLLGKKYKGDPVDGLFQVITKKSYLTIPLLEALLWSKFKSLLPWQKPILFALVSFSGQVLDSFWTENVCRLGKHHLFTYPLWAGEIISNPLCFLWRAFFLRNYAHCNKPYSSFPKRPRNSPLSSVSLLTDRVACYALTVFSPLCVGLLSLADSLKAGIMTEGKEHRTWSQKAWTGVQLWTCWLCGLEPDTSPPEPGVSIWKGAGAGARR